MVDRRLRRFLALPASALVLALTACGSSGGSTGGGLGSGDLLVGVLAPFSGADANLGPAYYAACLAAAPAINNNGGVGGRHVTCQKFDTRGEPRPHPDDRTAKIAKVGGGHALRGMAHDHLFEDHPHLLDFQRLAVGYQADPGATVWLAGDQSLLVQPDEGGPDGGPAGVQSTREIGFNQPFVRVKLATDDLVSKPPVGVGAAVGCRWRLAPRDGRR